MAGIGVFICDCKGLVSDFLDTARLAEEAARLQDVAFVERWEVLCGDADLGAAVGRLSRVGCDRLLFAGCSPRSSLKFPEERIAAVMRAKGLHPELFEVANVREQCAWQHSDPEAATAKAIDLVTMAHARLVGDEPAPRAVCIDKSALVVGGGPAGLQVAKDLAGAGVAVTLVERQPWLGGRLCQLNRIFQCEGWPSVCDSVCVGPVQAKGALLAAGVRVRTQTEVIGAERHGGNFRVTLRSDPQHVDPELCISCGACAEICPEETPRAYDLGMSLRKAIDKEFERALPATYSILPEACSLCGDCVTVCPTDAIDFDVESQTETAAYGAVFLATGGESLDLSAYPQYLGSHPDVVSSASYERLLDTGLRRPSDGAVPERIVFVQCAGSRAGPERPGPGVAYCSRTCCAVTTKQVDRTLAANPMVEPTVVYYRDMRTYERALEELYQRLRVMGVEFVNGEVEAIDAGDGAGRDGALSLTIEPLCAEADLGGDDDDVLAEPLHLEADLVVLAAAERPATASDALYEMFGVTTDRFGYPIEGQPRLFRPTESLVDRVYVVGSSVGPKVVQQASEQGSAAAMRALPRLLAGRVEPVRYASRVDPEHCIKCRICESVCPHGAIHVSGDGALVDPAFCQACGFCAAACPVNAAELTSFTDRQLIEQAKVAFRNLPAGEPRILALLCYWCAYSAADFAGIERVEGPINYRAIRIRCASSVNIGVVMEMFRLGVDGVLVAGCPERSCHHLRGNFLADKRTQLARAVMDQLGLDTARLRFEYIGAPMQAKLISALEKMSAKLRRLGPNPVGLLAEGQRGRGAKGQRGKGVEGQRGKGV